MKVRNSILMSGIVFSFVNAAFATELLIELDLPKAESLPRSVLNSTGTWTKLSPSIDGLVSIEYNKEKNKLTVSGLRTDTPVPTEHAVPGMTCTEFRWEKSLSEKYRFNKGDTSQFWLEISYSSPQLFAFSIGSRPDRDEFHYLVQFNNKINEPQKVTIREQYYRTERNGDLNSVSF
jgi:hypothetical protein